MGRYFLAVLRALRAALILALAILIAMYAWHLGQVAGWIEYMGY